MYHKTAITIVIAIALLLPGLGCGPNCQKIVSAKKPEELARDDAARINGLVERRKAAMEAAKGGNQYVIEDAKQTVTACEMAIKFQYQIVTLQEAGSPLIEQNIKTINEARCFLDEVLESKGKLIGTGKGAFISGSNARQIRSYHEEFAALFGVEGSISERRIEGVYEKGIKTPKAGKEEDAEVKDGPSEENETEAATEEGDEGDEGVDEFGDEAPDDKEEDEESGGDDNSSEGGMDSF